MQLRKATTKTAPVAFRTSGGLAAGRRADDELAATMWTSRTRNDARLCVAAETRAFRPERA